MTTRASPIFFGAYDTAHFSGLQTAPDINPRQQEDTTPLAKLSGSKVTRDFRNIRHPGEIIAAQFLGPRAVVDGPSKLVIHDGRKSPTLRTELFNPADEPAETTDLFKERPEQARQLKATLRTWQESVLKSFTGGDNAS